MGVEWKEFLTLPWAWPWQCKVVELLVGYVARQMQCPPLNVEVTMPIGIDPKVDFAFKMVFGNPEHTSITIHFLNSILNFPQPISAVEILNPIQDRNRFDDKLAILDILASDSEGRRYNIEMQTTLPAGLTQRLTYYNCLNYVKQLKSGREYERLRPAISICILDRVLFAETPEYNLSFQLRCDQQSQLIFNSDFRFYLLELPKFHPADNNMHRLDSLEKWLYFLRNAAGFERYDLSERLVEEQYQEALGVLEMISESPEDREFYEARMRFAEWERMALRQEGREEGRQEGLREGRKEGLVHVIQTLQEIVGETSTASTDLMNQTNEELSEILSDLQHRLRSRGD